MVRAVSVVATANEVDVDSVEKMTVKVATKAMAKAVVTILNSADGKLYITN